MPASATAAAPPNFYDNLPPGGDAAAGATASKKPKETDDDWELIKGAQGMYRVAMKMAEAKKELKPLIDTIKEDIKALFVKGLKQDPSALDSGDSSDKSSSDEGSAAGVGGSSSGGAPPSQTDETHAA